MDNVERVAQFVEINGAGMWIVYFKLYNGRWIYHSPVALTEATGPRSYWLLPHNESIVRIATF